MKVGDLVVSKAYQNYSNIVPAKLVVQVTRPSESSQHIVTADAPEEWKLADSFFVVSPA